MVSDTRPCISSPTKTCQRGLLIRSAKAAWWAGRRLRLTCTLPQQRGVFLGSDHRGELRGSAVAADRVHAHAADTAGGVSISLLLAGWGLA